MRPSSFNAFVRNGLGDDRASRRGLARMLAPMRACLSETGDGLLLQLDPIRAIDALRPWSALCPSPEALTLVCATGAADGADPDEPRSTLAERADRLAITVADAFGPHVLALAGGALRDLVAMSRMDGLTAVLIGGPVEARDADAIRTALTAGRSPLAVELRALATMRVRGDRTIALETRDRGHAAAFVAENFRHYLAALRGRPAAEFSPPETLLVDHLLDRSGHLAVRPIETEIYSTSIDIGISTSPSPETQPANESLIYDRLSDTWHSDG